MTVETLLPPSTTELEDSRSAALKAQEYLTSRLNPATSTQTATSFRSIPIIDLTKSFSSSASDRASIAAEINSACTTIGFFFITGHGIPPPVLASVITLAKRFFHDLSDEGKEKIHMRQSKYFRGYEPSAFSQVNAFEEKETKEAFNWGYESGLDPTGGDGAYVELDGVKEGKVNLWPSEEELPGFYEGIREYYGHVLQLSRHLFRLFALSLNLPESYFDPMMTHPGGIARLIRYPPATNPKPLSSSLSKDEEEEGEEIGLGSHTDYECFTLLHQDRPGLEILSPSGHWIAAPLVHPDGIVVNVGDFLMRWTNGVYKSTVHRVVNRESGSERYSIPLFFSINYDETVETLPSCVSEGNPSRYPPITAGKYVLDRLALTVEGGKY